MGVGFLGNLIRSDSPSLLCSYKGLKPRTVFEDSLQNLIVVMFLEGIETIKGKIAETQITEVVMSLEGIETKPLRRVGRERNYAVISLKGLKPLI